MINKNNIEKMRESLKTKTGFTAVPQLFQTPKELASRMRDELSLKPTDDVLEPQAGLGMLVGVCGAVWHPKGSMTAVEINKELSDRLRYEFPLSSIICSDFLTCFDLGEFDKIIMNPPFINAIDIKHILHALTLLREGGRLVSLCADGPRQRDKIMPLAINSGGFYESLGCGVFNDQGTNVSTALFVINKA